MSHQKLVRVIVQEQDGRPLKNARVAIESGPEPIPDIAALTNEHGEVSMSVPKPGEYRFVCVADRFAETHVEVIVTDADQSIVTVTLNRGI